MAGSRADGRSAGPGSPVSSIASARVALVDPAATLHEVATKLSAVEVGALVVSTTVAMVGIISERDLIVALRDKRDLETATAGDVASTDVIWCEPTATVGDARALMIEHHVRHLVVGDGSTPSAILSARDVLAALG